MPIFLAAETVVFGVLAVLVRLTAFEVLAFLSPLLLAVLEVDAVFGMVAMLEKRVARFTRSQYGHVVYAALMTSG